MHAWKTIFSFQAGPFSNDMLIFLGINLLTDQMLQNLPGLHFWSNDDCFLSFPSPSLIPGPYGCSSTSTPDFFSPILSGIQGNTHHYISSRIHLSSTRTRRSPRSSENSRRFMMSWVKDQRFLMDLYDLLGVFVHPSTKKDKPGFSQFSSCWE